MWGIKLHKIPSRKRIWCWGLKINVNYKMAAEKLNAFAVLKNIFFVKQIQKFELGIQ